ncbi:RING finger protein 24 [Datura stramonium]|uniref:RING-type E3 ubiquitin transferase n=1 Tax=Datura stramonium TaxID=4076 RepID=A0ABS8SQC4_DATST|nr:RING finger protein 24 [Datura stramonium]
MESYRSHTDNETFSGTLNATSSSTPANVPKDGSTTECLEREGDFGEDEDDEHDPTTENVSSEILLKLHEHMNVGSRVKAFYLSINLHKYESPKSTCLESKEHCCLCLVDYCDGEDLAKIDCGHVYHIDCIKEWIKLKNSCPICKRITLAALT